MDVFADHAKIEERQPAHRLEVFPQQGHRADDQRQHQHQRRSLGMPQLLDKPWSLWGFGLRDIEFLLGITRRVALVQYTHVVADAGRHPQHLLALLFADPVRHLHAFKQFDETAQVHRQRQA
ncbi:hypothetical protein D3C73_1285390 [compost metagenome]